jgi:hypothetical protein
MRQGGSCNIADVFYSFGRLYQALANTSEFEVAAAMEARFCRYDFPLLYVGMLLNPMYRALALKLISAGAVSGMRVRMWIDGYFSCWFNWESLRSMNRTVTSLVTAYSDWSSKSSSLVKLASSFNDSREFGRLSDASRVNQCRVVSEMQARLDCAWWLKSCFLSFQTQLIQKGYLVSWGGL